MRCRGVLLAIGLALLAGSSAWAKVPVRLPVELDDLLAPIALYPDPLLAQVLPASTVPGDLALAAKYLEDGGDLELVDRQPWTDHAKALARYPEVLRMMTRSRDWTDAVGAAFLDQPKDVINSLQRLRNAAMASGALRTTDEQRVAAEKGVVYIYPAEAKVLHLPQYDPKVVFSRMPLTGKESPVTFGSVLIAGYWLNYEIDWRKKRLYSYDYREFPYGRRNPWYFGGGETGEVPPDGPRQHNAKWKPDHKNKRPFAKFDQPLPTIQNPVIPAKPVRENEPPKPAAVIRPLAAPKDLPPPPSMLTPVDPEMESLDQPPDKKPAKPVAGAKKTASKTRSTHTKPARTKPTAKSAGTSKTVPNATKAAPATSRKTTPAAASTVKPTGKKTTPAPAPAKTGKSTPAKKKTSP